MRRAVQILTLVIAVVLVALLRNPAGQDPPTWAVTLLHIDPLIGLTTLVAAHTITWLLLLSLITVGLTIILGRVFCGWVCPLGTVNAIASRLTAHWRKKQPEHWSRWQLAKYVLLGALLVMAAFGAQWLVLLDPLVIFYRTTATTLLPATQYAVEGTTTAIYQEDPTIFGWELTTVTEPVYRWYRNHVIVKPGQAFYSTPLILGFFIALVMLNAVRARFWCRYLCPLGGLLGIFAWRPMLVRETNTDLCNQCEACGLRCHGASSDQPGSDWKPQECFGCLNCTDSCAQDGLAFKFRAPWTRRPQTKNVDLKKRHLLGAAGVGVAGLVMLRVTPQARGNTLNPKLIRPPGAPAEPDFLSKCIGCGACMKVCPTGGLQPALTEAGLEGLWTPVLVPKIGYCEYECNACGQVCPTGAIEPLKLAAKKDVRLGMATFDTSRCIPYALNEPCLVCEEHCPVPDKAIKLRRAGPRRRAGGLGRPGGGSGGGGRGLGRGLGSGGGFERQNEPAPTPAEATPTPPDNPYATPQDAEQNPDATPQAATENPYATAQDATADGGTYPGDTAPPDPYAAGGGEVLLPYVDYDLCIGCGICEHVCPFKAEPAIRVTSDNESRHPDRVPFLVTPS